MRRFVVAWAAVLALAGPALAQSSFAPAGAQFEARLDGELNTKRLHDGDTFTMTEHEGFFHKAPPALKGAKLSGHVENVNPAKMGHGATLNVVVDSVTMADGTTAPIHAAITSIKEFEPRTHHVRDAGLILGGAVVGHMVGSRHGVKHGGLAGAAAGLALATSLKSDIVVRRGTIVHLKLLEPVATAG